MIHSFALQMGDQTRLDYLYLLTVADINGTNQKLWNTWRASLMRQLYLETKRALHRGLENNVDKQEVIEETQQLALRKLERKRIAPEMIRQLWSDMGEQYFLRETAQDIAWHTEAMARHRDDKPLILIKNSGSQELGGATQIFIRSKGWKNVFAAAATALDQLNLNIQAARIYNSDSGYTLDTFFVLTQNGEPLGDDLPTLNQIQRTLEDELRLVDDYSEVITRRTPRRMKHFTMPTRTTISNDMISGCTVLEVISPDRPGLLASIGRIFLQFDILLQSAKIATLGERVEDIFFITDSTGEPLSDPTVCDALQTEIRQQLDQRVTGQQNARPASPIIH